MVADFAGFQGQKMAIQAAGRPFRFERGRADGAASLMSLDVIPAQAGIHFDVAFGCPERAEDHNGFPLSRE
jgi:hypothetical protein